MEIIRHRSVNLTFTAEDGYTAEQYIKDCDSNADDEWCEMLHRGTVTLVEVEE